MHLSLTRLFSGLAKCGGCIARTLLDFLMAVPTMACHGTAAMSFHAALALLP